MTGLDRGFTGDGGPRPEGGPFFPGAPLPAPSAAVTSTTGSGANALPMTLHGSSEDITTPVDGRVTIENGVIGKIAALAALEVAGVAALVPRPGAPSPGPGPDARRPAAGVRVDLDEDADEVTLDLAIAVEYGSVVKDVARVVMGNVARVTGLMLGTRVTAVNVSVEDVRVPGDQATARA
ncbi:putative alkaline shock family protein YloU [Actinomadura pelletieri DSM 43383]|uniref:Putative alkaline shock family protein YloU n=1 Tax=Actinomadura pelletieri DSM 43383 TaxID=1120940 RepID=A0A495Q9K5_9ACTN|nr:Asp23/Gls24 family envelope stress response protein [Actinomadura pelletieri]RKS67804.1 putative alkaline shock family protein YloU [Actinomadura pelletieri DSM 43383]